MLRPGPVMTTFTLQTAPHSLSLRVLQKVEIKIRYILLLAAGWEGIKEQHCWENFFLCLE